MVKFLHLSGEAKMSRPVCGVRLGVRRVAMMAIGFVACLYAGNANAQNWTGSTPDEAKDKTVYLWNVGAKQFLGKGGRWGTEAVISTVGTPFVVKDGNTSGTYKFQSLVKAEGATTNGYLSFMDGKNSVHDFGNFFTDRSEGVDYLDASHGNLYFTLTGDASGYDMSITSKGGSDNFVGTFHLVADMKNTQKAIGNKEINTDSAAFSKWIIVTEEERRAAFENAESDGSTAVPASFLMNDHDFARNDNGVTNWQTRTSSSSTTFDGNLENVELEKKPSDAYSTSSPYIYYVGNGHASADVTTDEDGNAFGTTTDDKGQTNDIKHNWQVQYGGDWTANIHGTYGVVNQTIQNKNMVREGWYKISCVGFTTTTQGKAQLFVSAGTANEEGKYYAVQPLKMITEDLRPTTYVKASRLVNGGGYEASAMVYIDKNTAGNLKTLSFGVWVEDADADAWTCFDNFQIEYFGMPSEVLVLDEEQENVDYINAQITPATIDKNYSRTLYLHRTVNAGKWNSIVLPVDLTVGQVKSAFGDDVRISAFKGATDPNLPGRMYFEAIKADRSNNNEVAIKAGKLYIIKPSKEEPTTQSGLSFPKDCNIKKTLTSYFTIPQVTFTREERKATVEGDVANETYGDNAPKVQFVGTYVKGTGLIPANSYVLRGNKDDEAGLWFYRTIATNTKGFRGWLQTSAVDANKVSFSINGVVDETTGIEGLTIDGTASTTGIYNLNGQLVRKGANSTEGLAKGIYVVGGRKVVVK